MKRRVGDKKRRSFVFRAANKKMIAAFLAVTVLVLVHLFAGKLRFLEGIPRNKWLSFAGGASVAYIFLHLIPELGKRQEKITSGQEEFLGFLEHPIFLVALIGLVTFYGLERMAKLSRRKQQESGGEDQTGRGVFWIHILSFAVYNLLIGYLLMYIEQPRTSTIFLFSAAMALHFIVNDFGLQEHHRETYYHLGRWILSGAVILGFCIGLLIKLPEPLFGVLIAFIAGGVILNVLKEELPEERKSRFFAFVFGVVGYGILLIAL